LLRVVLHSPGAFTLGGSFFIVARSCERLELCRRRRLHATRIRPFLFRNRDGLFRLGIGAAFGLSVQPRLNARCDLSRLLLRRRHCDGRLDDGKHKRGRAADDGDRSNEIREKPKEERHGAHATRPSVIMFRISDPKREGRPCEPPSAHR
jgi:hypothetical protein